MYMVNERRPRIPAELAEHIDSLRDDMPFEKYIAEVLQRHVDHRIGTPEGKEDIAYLASRVALFEWEDRWGTEARAWIDRLPLGGWGSDQHPDVLAGMVLEDEEHGALGIYMDAMALRGLRDAITDVLNDGPWNSEPED